MRLQISGCCLRLVNSKQGLRDHEVAVVNDVLGCGVEMVVTTLIVLAEAMRVFKAKRVALSEDKLFVLGAATS
jgi:hypothetical protein